MKKSNVITNHKDVKCKVCGKNLMENQKCSMINIVENVKTHKIKAFAPCCKGKCDDILKQTNDSNYVSRWMELIDFSNPYLYLKYIMSVYNNMHNENCFENDESFDDFKNFMIAMYPYVARDMEKNEIENAVFDNNCPQGL